MALLLASGLTTLAVVRNADPSTPEAVEDVQTLVVELEALNGYLATTNQLMSDAITNAEYMSANVQAELAGMSAQLGDVEAGVGHARSLLGSQLSGTTRSELGKGQEELQSLQRTLAQAAGQLGERQLAAIGRDVAAIAGRGRARNRPGLQSHEHYRGSNRGARERADSDRRTQDADCSAPSRCRAAQGDDTRPAGRAQALAAQVQELKRAVALLRERVETMTPSPSS